MKDDTPYRERPATEIEHEQKCMRSIFAAAPQVPFIFEAFGGLGKTAQVLAERFPKVQVLSSETDAECVQIYNTTRPTTRISCVHIDAMALLGGIRHPPRKWGASLDFNRFTLMDLQGRKEGQWKIDLIAAVVERKPAWIQVTDSAIRYLHLNHQRYGCQNTPKAYQSKVGRSFQKRWNFGLSAAAHYHAASYLLLTPS
jgi:hypothetical protein